MMQRLKVVPSYIITSYLAGDYFQALRNIIIENRNFSFSVSLSTRCKSELEILK